MSQREDVYNAWVDKQKAMGRRIPFSSAPYYDTRQNECTCEIEKTEKKDYLGTVIHTTEKRIYNPECMIHGQAFST